MDKEKILNLINDLYRITSLFPKKEPLKYKMREVGDELLFYFVSLESLKSENPGSFAKDSKSKIKESIFEIEKNIEIIDNYFDVAKWQNWASYFDILELQNKYRYLKEWVKEEIEDLPLDKSIISKEENKVKIEKTEKTEPILTERQKKIISFLKNNSKAQVSEITKILPDVAKRTLRRDFLDLMKKGVVSRIGEKNNTYYSIKIN